MLPQIVLVCGLDYPHYDHESSSKVHRLRRMDEGSTREKNWNWRKCASRLANLAIKRRGTGLAFTVFDFDLGIAETYHHVRGVMTRREKVHLGAVRMENYRCFTTTRTGVNDDTLLLPMERQKEPLKQKGYAVDCLYFPGINLVGTGAVRYGEYRIEHLKTIAGRSKSVAEESMSIQHVYEAIRLLGELRKTGDAGIVELHFLCHAWRRGPILVNTFDFVGGLPHRDPLDRDARGHKDFGPANMTDKTLAQFRGAFAQDALVCLWGCDQNTVVKELIRQTWKQRKPPFDFSYNECWGSTADHERVFGNRQNDKFTWDEALQVVREEWSQTYMQTLATTIDKPVIGVVPGTSSDPDPVGREALLWHVGGLHEKDNLKGDDCGHPPNARRWLRFYADRLKVQFDQTVVFGAKGFDKEFGRGFARYEPEAKK